MKASTGCPLAGRVVGGLIRGYQLVLSPWVTQQCRYYPSCSSYALEAVRVHGAARGVALAAWRLMRCNPFTPGGVDYVRGSPDAVSYASRVAAEARSQPPDDLIDGPAHPDHPSLDHDTAGSHRVPAALLTPSAPRN